MQQYVAGLSQYTGKAQKQYEGDQKGTAAARYQSLEMNRRPFLDRARECAELTIPALIPPDGWTGTSPLYTPFQGLGARGVNNLASKMLLAQWPANAKVFRLRMDPSEIAKAKAAGEMQDDAVAEIEAALSKVEDWVGVEIETGNMRGPIFELTKHLIVGGNALVFKPKQKNELRMFPLDRYVVRRDPMGNVLEIVVKETISPTILEEQFQKAVEVEQVKRGKGDDKNVDLYTWVRRIDGEWNICQEVCGMIVPKSEGAYPIDKNRWIPLRWMRIAGEDYGRGHVEEYLGDLKSLEGLSQSIVEGSAAAAKLLVLVDPTGSTKLKTVQDAPNGAIREGRVQDIGVLQLNKFNDFRVAKETADGIERRLSFAFLLNSSVQRAGERVTAEEIRFMAQELEDALGGVYSVQAVDTQLPLIKVIMWDMEQEGRLPKLPQNKVKPMIVTGLQALGRGHDLEKIRAYLNILKESFGPEIAARIVNQTTIATMIATALSLDTKDLNKTEEQLAQEAQQAQMQAMIEKLGPKAMDAMSKNPQAAAQMQQGQGEQAPPSE